MFCRIPQSPKRSISRKLLAGVPALALWLGGTTAWAQYTQPQTLPPPPSVQGVQASTSTSGPMALTDVVAMTQSGLSDEIIARAVGERGVGRALSAQDLIYLKQSGVSTYVIDAVQRSAFKPAAAAPVATVAPTVVEPVRVYQPAPVVVQPYHYYHAPYYQPYTRIHFGHGHHHHHHHRHHGHGGTRISFGFGF